MIEPIATRAKLEGNPLAHALVYAVEQDWLAIEREHSAALKDAGHQMCRTIKR